MQREQIFKFENERAPAKMNANAKLLQMLILSILLLIMGCIAVTELLNCFSSTSKFLKEVDETT